MTLLKPFFVILFIIAIGVSSALGEQEGAKEKEITIVIIEAPPLTAVAAKKAAKVPAPMYCRKEVKQDAGIMAKKFKEFMENMGTVLGGAPSALGDLTLDEIELHIEINAAGGFNLIGKTEVGATTGIKVILKRHPKRP